MTNIRLAIFDLAGTTVRDDNTVGGCLQQALKEGGLHLPLHEINSVMGLPKPKAIKMLLERHKVSGDADAIFGHFQDLMAEAYRSSDFVEEIEGASEVFRGLRSRGIQVAVNTGFDRLITTILLERLPWEDLLDDSITSDEVVNGRPSPDMILALCQRAGVAPEHTIKVGDTPSDIQEGRSAGVGLVAAALFGTHTREELEPFCPDVFITELPQILELDL